MGSNLVFGLTALMSLVPASVLPYRRAESRRDLVFWALLGAAVAGPVAFSLAQVGGSWKTGLATALWVSIAVSVTPFAALAAVTRDGWRLTPLLLPYLFILGVLAMAWSYAPAARPLSAPLDAWLTAHILVSVATYALATLAAVAGAAVFLQERALKRKQPGGLSALLPSFRDAERLQVRLLGAAEAVLGVGIVTGMAISFLSRGALLPFDHKTMLSLIAFGVIALLLFLHHRTGLRGQRAARIVLVAYLLLTLAYPGVKFVTDVLIG